MAANFKPSTVLYLLILYIISAIPHSFSQPNSPQNIQTFYPSPPPTPPPPIFPPPFTVPPPTNPPLPLQPPSPPARSSTSAAVGRAIGITAASTLVLSGVVYFLLLRYNRRKRDQRVNATAPNGGNNPVMPPQFDNFTRVEGNIKGLIVDENGLDVLYWRKLEEGDDRSSFKKEYYKSLKQKQKEEEKRVVSERSNKHKQPVQEAPLLRGKSSSSQSPIWGEKEQVIKQESSVSFKVEEDQDSTVQLIKISTKRQPSLSSEAVQKGKVPPSPPPPQPPPPPLPPPLDVAADLKGKMAAPPVVLPSAGASASLLTAKAPKGSPNKRSLSVGIGKSSKGNEQEKLKHSMAWDKIAKGSKFDGDIMEALFGYVATNRKSPRKDGNSPSPRGDKQGSPSQIFILDTWKSQDIALVLKSLAITRKEIIDALVEGQGLNADTIEKLNKIAPTDEESSKILAFDGDPTRLADAESFLYHLLKAVPSAFSRFNAMLFRTNYDSKVWSFKESLQSLESACNELRTRGLFLKLLEAVLKAGNQLNAGTSKGNAQVFNLTALRKLSDVKSSDGKTTLLQFVVQEVIRVEGKRCVRNKNQTLIRTSSRSSKSGSGIESSDKSTTEDDLEREYMMLGLPIIGGISAEISNVKKAALLDYDLITKTTTALAAQVMEIRKTVANCGADDGFARKMNGFLDTAELEVKVLKEEETRVMDVVKITAEYYQVGSLNDKGTNSFQLFVIVRDFLGMVDQVCVDIARNVQNRKPGESSSSGSPRVFRFPKLPANFMSDSSKSSSSTGSDNDSGVR